MVLRPILWRNIIFAISNDEISSLYIYIYIYNIKCVCRVLIVVYEHGN